MSFNHKCIAQVMSDYGCEQLSIDRAGKVYALKPGIHQEVPGLIFDTDSFELAETHKVLDQLVAENATNFALYTASLADTAQG